MNPYRPDSALVPLGVRLLLRTKTRALTNRVAQAVQASPLQIGCTVLFIAVIWLGLYGLFYAVFDYFRQLPLEGAVAVPLIFNFFFVALLVLLTFSNAIIAYTSLFRREEASYLLAAPLPPKDLVIVKYFETLLFSSWSLILLGLPLMLAIADFTRERGAFYALFLATFLFFVPIPGALGLLAAWGTARFLPQTGRRLLTAGGVVGLVLVTLWGLRTIQLSDGYSSSWLKQFFLRVDFVQSALLPSAWVSRGISRAMHDKPIDALLYLAVTLANALFLSLVAIRVVSRGFLAAFDRASAARGRTERPAAPASRGLVGLLFFYLPTPLRLIAAKDFRTFLRDPMQWSQLVILFGLMALYLVNMPQFHLDLMSPTLSLLIPFLNLSAVSFILATFTTRFVFPLVSLEGHQFWLIGLLPIPRRSILLAKFAFAITVCATVAVGTMGLASYILRLPLTWSLLYLAVTFAVCFGLCGLAVGLGARLPVFDERNPTRIANGFGGTVNLIASVGMIGLVLAGMGTITRRVQLEETLAYIDGTVIGISILVILLAAVTGVVSLFVGTEHLKRLEV